MVSESQQRVRGTRVMVRTGVDETRGSARRRGLAWQAWARTHAVPDPGPTPAVPSRTHRVQGIERQEGETQTQSDTVPAALGWIGKIRVASVPIELIGQSATKPRRRSERLERRHDVITGRFTAAELRRD